MFLEAAECHFLLRKAPLRPLSRVFLKGFLHSWASEVA